MRNEQCVEVELVGGPLNGERRVVRGKPLVLYCLADCAYPVMSPRITPIAPLIRHAYRRDADGRYVYEGDE